MNSIPQYHTLILPLLKVMGGSSEVNSGDRYRQIRDCATLTFSCCSQALLLAQD